MEDCMETRRAGRVNSVACGESLHQNKLETDGRVWCGPRSMPIEGSMMKRQLSLAGLVALWSVAVPAMAQDKIKIGVIVTLSGPAAALGQQVRDGFALGVKDLGGKMGGKDVEVVAVDDELKPDGAVTK